MTNNSNEEKKSMCVGGREGGGGVRGAGGVSGDVRVGCLLSA